MLARCLQLGAEASGVLSSSEHSDNGRSGSTDAICREIFWSDWRMGQRLRRPDFTAMRGIATDRQDAAMEGVCRDSRGNDTQILEWEAVVSTENEFPLNIYAPAINGGR